MARRARPLRDICRVPRHVLGAFLLPLQDIFIGAEWSLGPLRNYGTQAEIDLCAQCVARPVY